MDFIIDTAKVVEVFCFIDGFCQEVKEYFASHPLPKGLRPKHPAGRKSALSESEVLTILTLYHLSGFKRFEYYYERLVLGQLRSFFPKAVSYTQFLSLARQGCFHAFLLAQCRASLSARTGHYYVDSKKLPVCDNLRIHQHKVFEGIAARGRGSTGWFYGLKLHLVINQHGELARLLLTLQDKLNLLKRGGIEAVNDILMTVCDIDHSRHRNPLNALVHILSGLTAYTFLDHQNSKFNPARCLA